MKEIATLLGFITIPQCLSLLIDELECSSLPISPVMNEHLTQHNTATRSIYSCKLLVMQQLSPFKTKGAAITLTHARFVAGINFCKKGGRMVGKIGNKILAEVLPFQLAPCP